MKFDESIFSERMKPISGSVIRDIFKLLGDPDMISFAGGNPSNAALESDVVAELAQDVLKQYGPSLLQYGATEGMMPLRESTAAFLKNCGISCTGAEILPTQGSTQAIDLLIKAVINPGDTILVESPTFLGSLQAMKIYQANIVPVPTDEGGLILEEVEKAILRYHPKMLYVIPTFQNPTGITLAADRRKPLAEMVNKYGVILAENDPYRDLRYDGEACPAIKAYDENGWVVYLTSYSKLISPGMRVGAAVVSNPALLRKMVIGKQSSDVHTPLLNQAIVNEYLRRGLLMPHIRRICGNYRRQMHAMLDGFRFFPEGTVHTQPQGGLFVWAALPEGMNAAELLPKAVANKVAYVPGTHFYPEGGHENTLRLNFSMSEPEAIERGMRALGETFKA